MLALGEVLDLLASVYGEPVPPPRRSVFELLLLDNVAYLVDDTRRSAAFEALTRDVGVRPEQILNASPEALEGAAGAGILPEHQAQKLRRIAELATEQPLDDLADLSLRDAKRVLMRFPSIGEPGAEKILLLSRSHPVLGLDSNGVRALTRLGIVEESSSYAATYRNVQRAVEPYLQKGFDWLIRAQLLLRQHGQELCRRSRPRCDRCPLTDHCAYYAGTGTAGPSADHVSPR
jgi:endonuclease III